MPAGRSAAWRRLSTAVLQEYLLAALWGIQDNEQGVRVVHHDAARAIAAADASPGGTAVIGNPLRAADVYAVAARRGTAAPQVHLVRAQAEDRAGPAVSRCARFA